MKNNYIKVLRLCSHFFLLLMATSTYGQLGPTPQKQKNNVDFGLWTGSKLTAKIKKSWAVNLTAQARMKSIVREFDRCLVELETYYNPRFHALVKPMKIGVGVRYFAENNKEVEHYLRIHLDFVYKLKIQRFHAVYRFRYQAKDDLKEEESVYRDQWTQDVRNLIKIGFNLGIFMSTLND